jgi:hypothetical protein
MSGWSSTSGVKLGARVRDLQGDSNCNVEMLDVFVLKFRRLVLESFIEGKELKSRKCCASRVPKLTELSSPVLMHVHRNPCHNENMYDWMRS